VAEVDVRSRGVDSELHAERTAEREAAGELAGGQAVDRVTRELLGCDCD
jgi:hypothetical protein